MLKLPAFLLLSLAILGGCARPPHVVYTNESTKVVPTEARGSYVYLSFSRAANTVYLGRSDTSAEGAVADAVRTCPFSDCRKVYASTRNGCVAFAINNDELRRWGSAYGETPEDATLFALKSCNARLKVENCHPVVVHCSAF